MHNAEPETRPRPPLFTRSNCNSFRKATPLQVLILKSSLALKILQWLGSTSPEVAAATYAAARGRAGSALRYRITTRASVSWISVCGI